MTQRAFQRGEQALDRHLLNVLISLVAIVTPQPNADSITMTSNIAQNMYLEKMTSVLRVIFVLSVFAIGFARAQTETDSLFPAAFTQDRLRGEVEGTGSAGTTFLLSGTLSVTETGTTAAAPLTLTLVEDAMHISEVAVFTQESVLFSVNVQCGLASDSAFCTETISEKPASSQLASTNVAAGPETLFPVPVVTKAGTSTGASTTHSATSSSTKSTVVTSTSSSSDMTTPSTTSTQPIQNTTIISLAQTSPAAAATTSASGAPPLALGSKGMNALVAVAHGVLLGANALMF